MASSISNSRIKTYIPHECLCHIAEETEGSFKKNKTVKEGGAKKKMDRSAESHFEASDKKTKTS